MNSYLKTPINDEELALWQHFLSQHGKHYDYSCACEYCAGLRNRFAEWRATRWCKHICRNIEGVYCFNGFQMGNWQFCPICGMRRPILAAKPGGVVL